MTVAEQFAVNLRRCRERAGVSQERLAFLASVNRTAVSFWENAERIPRLDSIVKLAGALGATSDDLLVGIAWEPPTRRPYRGRFAVHGEPTTSRPKAAGRACRKRT